MYPVPEIQVRTATTNRKDANEAGQRTLWHTVCGFCRTAAPLQRGEYHTPRLFRHLYQVGRAGTSTIGNHGDPNTSLPRTDHQPLRSPKETGVRLQFTSKAFKDFLKETGVEPQITAPYCPRENPTERVNRTIKTMIAQYVENGKNTWDRTPELSLAINTSVSYKLGSHGYPDPGPGTATSPQNPSERAERLKEVFLIVQKHLQKNINRERRSQNS